MKHFYLITIPLLLAFHAHAGDVEGYMLKYARTGQSDYKQEKELIESTRLEKLIRELDVFYTDSSGKTRQKAYYLTYKKGTHPGTKSGTKAIHKLLEGCKDKDRGIAGQNIKYLQQFSQSSFDDRARKGTADLLNNKRMPHYKELALLAGFTGAGKEILYQKFLDREAPAEMKLYIAFALARMGEQEAISYCLGSLREQKVSDPLVDYLTPLAIYSRQKELVKFCEGIIFLDKKQCHSPNPDFSGKILCGYRVLELIAPVIKDFPVQTDATGTISGKSYEDALVEARQWFKDNPDYKLNTDIF